MIRIQTEKFIKVADYFSEKGYGGNLNQQGSYPPESPRPEPQSIYCNDVGGDSEQEIKDSFSKKKKKKVKPEAFPKPAL